MINVKRSARNSRVPHAAIQPLSEIPSSSFRMQIHPTALIGPKARLDDNVRVGPYAVIEDEVEIGADCEIGAHAVIKRFTLLGERNRIFEHAILGGEPQDLKFKGEESRLVVGSDNIIREFCTLH